MQNWLKESFWWVNGLEQAIYSFNYLTFSRLSFQQILKSHSLTNYFLKLSKITFRKICSSLTNPLLLYNNQKVCNLPRLSRSNLSLRFCFFSNFLRLARNSTESSVSLSLSVTPLSLVWSLSSSLSESESAMADGIILTQSRFYFSLSYYSQNTIK